MGEAVSVTASGQRGVIRWLMVVYGMIFVMVLVGGITRLTGSGLSMVEWRPLMGALPPLSEQEWIRVFERYQEFPQYAKVNHWMTLLDFKAIFFWEYFHRLLGRLIGVVFFLPWLYFWLKKQLPGKLLRKTAIAFTLGGAQGLLGWFMVKSGLSDNPEVSHYRLAAHLSLAFIVAQYTLWLIFELRWPQLIAGTRDGVKFGTKALYVFISALSLQIVYGAFMAGTRAGFISSTFPDINGEMIPSAMFVVEPWWRDLMENLFSIHFIHRSLGYLVFAGAVYVWLRSERAWQNALQRLSGRLLMALALAQVLMGIGTVVMNVPVALAAAHQGGAFLLLSSAVLMVYVYRGEKALKA